MTLRQMKLDVAELLGGGKLGAAPHASVPLNARQFIGRGIIARDIETLWAMDRLFAGKGFGFLSASTLAAALRSTYGDRAGKGVARSTANQSLARLQAVGLIKRTGNPVEYRGGIGDGPAFTYVVGAARRYGRAVVRQRAEAKAAEAKARREGCPNQRTPRPTDKELPGQRPGAKA